MLRIIFVAIGCMMLAASAVAEYEDAYTVGYVSGDAYGSLSSRDQSGENLLAETVDFNATEWGGVDPKLAITGGQDDPLGGTSMALWMVAYTGANLGQQQSEAIYPTGDYITASFYVKNVDVPSASYVRFVDNNGSVQYGVTVDWSGGNPPMLTGTTFDDSGVIDLGSGWYRIWFTVDLATRSLTGHDFDLRIVACGNSSTEGVSIYIGMPQVQNGQGPPGKYIENGTSEYENLFPESEDFTSAGGFWGRWILTQGTDTTAPPFATGTAQQYSGTAGQAGAFVYKSGWEEEYESVKYCFSVYVKDNGTNGHFDLSFQGGPIKEVEWIFASGVPLTPTVLLGAPIMGTDYRDAASGWYRLYIGFDNSTPTSSGGIRTYISVNEYTVANTNGVYLWGAQLDVGVMTPRAYRAKP